MKNSVSLSKSGQTSVEYIMLLAVVVGVSYALKTPMSRYLVQFFGNFNGRATSAAAKPTKDNYLSSESKGCAAIKGGAACE